MSGIAGCTRPGTRSQVEAMLEGIAHRGRAGSAICETDKATLGIAWTPAQASAERMLQVEQVAMDDAGPGRFASGTVASKGIRLARDPVGVAPLYYGKGDGSLYFASEVKALLPFTAEVRDLPAGYCFGAVKLAPYVPPVDAARGLCSEAEPNTGHAQEVLGWQPMSFDAGVHKYLQDRAHLLACLGKQSQIQGCPQPGGLS